LLGNGDGTFAAALNYPAGQGPIGVAVGDFNGDGLADLAVANFLDNTLGIWLGNGNGTFAAAVNYPTGQGPISVVAADFNGDGNADLAVANSNSNNVAVFFGSGDGTFAAAVYYPVSGNPVSLALGDLSQDGLADLVTGNFSGVNVSVLLGNGQGTFAAAVNYPLAGNPATVAVGDLNGDGRADLAVTNFGSTNVSVLLGNGDGTFAAKVDYPVGTHPYSVAIGDFNGDGRADLVIANFASDTVSVLLGNGDGTFTAGVSYPTGAGPNSVAVADFNGDGRTDLAVASAKGNSLGILLGKPLITIPQAISANPAAGGGANQTFTFVFSDADGWQQLGVMNILINRFLDGRQACYVAYVASGATTGSLYLVDDAGNAGGPFAAMALPGSATIQNSQCAINGAGSSVTASGNILTLTLAITFKANFSGNKVFYMAAGDKAQQNSGWQALAVWGVPGPAATGPSVIGVSPPRSITTGQTYQFTFTDTSGWQDIEVTNILINNFLDGRQACYLTYVPSGATTGSLYLVDDAGNAGGPYAATTLPGSGTIQNSQCAINAAGSSAVANGNTLTLTLAVTFKLNFAGNRVMYLAARNSTQNSDWQAVATVTVR